MTDPSQNEYPELDEGICWACLDPIVGPPIRTRNTTVCSDGCRAATEEAMIPARPEVGTFWRDREGNTWRLAEYIDGGPWCSLVGVTRFDGAPFAGARWHADWMLDLTAARAVQIDA